MYKFCDEKKRVGNEAVAWSCMWDRTAPLTGISRSSAQRIMQEMKKAWEEQQQPKQRQKCRWMTLIRVVYGEPSPPFSPLRRFNV